MEPKQEIIVSSIVFGSVRSDSLREEKASKSSTLPLLKKKNSVKKRKVISQDIRTSFCSDTKKKQECLSTKENVEEQKEQRQ